MASPQKSNGYVPIANELLEAIYRADLTRNELRVLLCIIRHTYGYNSKSSRLSLGFIASDTGLAKPRVSEALGSLKGKNITIIGNWQSKEPREIAVQKDYEKWVLGYEKRNGYEIRNGYEKRNARVTNSVTPTSNKDNIKNNIYIPRVTKNVTQDSLPDWFDEVWKEYPSKKGKNRISKKCYKELIEAGKDKLLSAVRNYKAYCEKNQWYHPQNGSTFFNGGWKDYIEPTETENGNEYDGMDFFEILSAMKEKGDI